MLDIKNIKLDKFRNFAKNESGSFVPIFAMSVFAISMSAGAALDFSRMSNTKSRIDAALDSALLAAGREMTNGVTNETEIRNKFDAYLSSNLVSPNGLALDYNVKEFNLDIETGAIEATISSDVKMAMMSIAGYDELPVASNAQAVFSSDAVEVAMMLDVTGSMGYDGKLESMKKAAKAAIGELMPEESSSNKVRIGLVPYSWSVNATEYYAKKVTANASVKCVTERTDVTDAKPLGSKILLADERGERCPSASIRPLTNQKSILEQDIENYEANGLTAGHLGVAWSYYMLSEKWQSVWKTADDPSDYGSNTKKIAILMTDGEFNTYYNGVPLSHDVTKQGDKSSDTAVNICADMKAKKGSAPGITVYSVAFDAPSSAQATLEQCSSGDGYYFAASSEAELVDAFKSIAKSIKKLRLAR